MSGEDDTIPKVPLTDKEKEQFVIAMTLGAKCGLPSVDFDKFTDYAGFNTKKTAQNTWSKIKGKLPAPEEGEDGEEGGGKKKTPKKTPKATPKKRTKKSEETVEEEDGNDVEATPSKKAKKSPKKKVVAAADPEAAPEEEGEAGEE